MKSSELKTGRVFGLIFGKGEDFLGVLNEFCKKNNIKQAIIPSFIGSFTNAEIIGTCEKLDDPELPDFRTVHVEYMEAMGSGSIAYDEKKGCMTPHIHLSVGERMHSAMAYTGHLMKGEVSFLVELLLVEVLEPTMKRVNVDSLYSALTFEE